MSAKKIVKLRFDSWSRYGSWQGAAYEILPVFCEQRTHGDHAKFIHSRIETTTCPTCGSALRREQQNPSARRDETGTRTYYHLCDACGFWRFELCDDVNAPCYAIPHVKRFDYETTTPSLSHLSREIHRNRQKVYAMDPTKFEIFVGSVLSDFLDCDVHHVGRSGDDGVDLIALTGDAPLMIQVKRRERPSATESIDVVKLLFASAFAQGARNGMVVTSAKRFTRPAKVWSESSRILDIGFKLELVDINSLMSMVGAIASKDTTPAWHQHRDQKRATFRESHNHPAHKLLHGTDFDAV